MENDKFDFISKERVWEEKFHQCLALEFSQASYFAVHHLLMLSYMLQTDSYSSEIFPKAVDLLEKFLWSQESPKLLIADFISSKTVAIRNSGQKNINKFNWDKSILNIRTENSEIYCLDVIKWAKNVLAVIREQTTTNH